MEKLMEWLKKLLGKGSKGAEPDKKPLWKKLNTMFIVAAGGILLIVLSNAFPSGGDVPENAANPDPVEKQTDTSPVRSSSSDIVSMENNQARSLEAVLSQIEGVGDVSVTVNFASTPERNFAVNTSIVNKKTTENDQKGGNRIVTEEDESGQMVLVRENQGNREEPVVVKEIKPEVRGVIVVAEGAEDPETRTSLMNAVSVYLDIPLYKVVVLSKESR